MPKAIKEMDKQSTYTHDYFGNSEMQQVIITADKLIKKLMEEKEIKEQVKKENIGHFVLRLTLTEVAYRLTIQDLRHPIPFALEAEYDKASECLSHKCYCYLPSPSISNYVEVNSGSLFLIQSLLSTFTRFGENCSVQAYQKVRSISNMEELKNIVDHKKEFSQETTKTLTDIWELSEQIEREFELDLEDDEKDINRFFQEDIVVLVTMWLKVKDDDKPRTEKLLRETLLDIQWRLQQIIDRVEAKYIFELEKTCQLMTLRYNPTKSWSN